MQLFFLFSNYITWALLERLLLFLGFLSDSPSLGYVSTVGLSINVVMVILVMVHDFAVISSAFVGVLLSGGLLVV